MANDVVLRIHAIPCADSNGKRKYDFTAKQLENWVKDANIVFKQAGIRLHFDAKETWTWAPVKDTKLNNLTRTGNWAAKPNGIAAKRPGKIVVFFRHGEGKDPTGNGYAYPPDIGKPIPPSWKWEPKNVNFVAMPNAAKNISGGFLAHEIGHYLGLYHTFPGAGSSIIYPDKPDGKLEQISAGSSTRVWGVNADDKIYRRDSNGWELIAGKLKHVSVASDGTVWGVNASNNIYRRSGSKWTKVAGKLEQISVGSQSHVWGVNAGNNIYRRTGSKWTQVAGKLKHVSVGKDGTVWGVNAGDNIYRWTGSGWSQVPGKLKQISVGDKDNIWGVNSKDDIYRRSGNKWVKVAGKLKYVSVASSSVVWGVNAGDNVYRRSGSQWAKIGGGHGKEQAKRLLHLYISKNGGKNKALNGDLITDTPPDPNPTIYDAMGWPRCDSKTRVVTGSYGGKTYRYSFDPQVDNVMSYFSCPMPRKLTKGQRDRIHLTLEHKSRKLLVQPPCPPDFHGLPAGQFQLCFDYWVNRGLWPRTLSATLTGSTLRMAGSFQKRSPRPVRHLISGSSYQAAFETLKKAGYRPERVTAAKTSGGTRFTAIWTRTDGVFEARHGLTLAAFDSLWHSLYKKGYVNTDLSVYATGSGPRVAAVWVKRSSKGYATYYGMTSSQYNKRFEEFWKKGLRVVCFSAYRVGNAYRYAAIWERLPGSWAHYYGMTSSGYQKRYNELAAKGLRLHQVQAYGTRFSAVWTKP